MKADKDINYRYWLTNITRATTENCFRLADACGCSLDADAVARYIMDIAEGRKRGEQSSPFPALLRGHLRGMFQPKHLMLKLACVRDAEAAINYEFLMEYGLFEASTGIYFGIKAVSDSKTSDDAFTTAADSAVAALSRRSPRLFSCRRLSCLPHTDNAENGSYWPLWLPSGAYRDLKDEIRLLHRLFGYFMKALPELETVYDVFDDFEAQRHGATPFDELGNRIAAVFGSDESAALFGKFVDNACRRGILASCGKGQWRFNRHWAVTRRGRPLKMTKKVAFDLLSVLFDIIALRCGTARRRYIPWKELRAVMLDAASRPFGDSWQRQSTPPAGTPYYTECEALCLALMELPASDL